MKTRKTITIDGTIYELSDEFLSHVLETAAQGGCAYWADVEVVDQDSETADHINRDRAELDYTEEEEEGNEDEPAYLAVSFLASKDPAQGGTLDLEAVADAIERIASEEVEVPEPIREVIVTAVRDGDASEIDAEAADCIVQVGLFDEIVYS
jgi:hypothetical protein